MIPDEIDSFGFSLAQGSYGGDESSEDEKNLDQSSKATAGESPDESIKNKTSTSKRRARVWGREVIDSYSDLNGGSSSRSGTKKRKTKR